MRITEYSKRRANETVAAHALTTIVGTNDVQMNQVGMLRSTIEQAMQSVPDDVALTAVTLFPEWANETEYAVDARVKYAGVLYRCLTAHTSQETWTPDAAPSLWAKVLIPDENVIPEWEQPSSTNPYMEGDVVTHNGVTYESTVDNNVWEPGAVGTEALWIVKE